MARTLTYAVADGVATITLNRPERLNAFDRTMFAELLETFDATDADDDVRAVIVTGAGRAFCAGADLGSGGRAFRSNIDIGEGPAPRDRGGELVLRIFRSLKPVIAAINGSAVGVGASMTLPMDIRILAEGPRWGSSSRPAASCPTVRPAGSCRGLSGSTRRWSGASPVGCSRPPRRWPAAWSAVFTPPRRSFRLPPNWLEKLRPMWRPSPR